MSVVVSVIFGFILLLAVTFAIPDTQGVIDAGGYAVTYIWETSMSETWAKFLLFIVVVAQMFCLTASVTSASRMMYAFSRDGRFRATGLAADLCERVPMYAVMAIGVLSWLLMVPTLRNAVVGYLVGTSIAVIGLYIAFGIPVYLGGARVTASSAVPGTSASGTSGSTRSRSPGSADLHPVHPPDRAGRRPGERRVRLERRQLRAADGRRSVPALRRLVRAFGQKWFKGPVRQGTEEELERIEASTSLVACHNRTRLPSGLSCCGSDEGRPRRRPSSFTSPARVRTARFGPT